MTHWSEKTELFMEYPPLLAGRAALFAVHLTRMDDFRPVLQVRRRWSSPEEGGQPKTLVGPQPSRPGAFRVEDTPPAPGSTAGHWSSTRRISPIVTILVS